MNFWYVWETTLCASFTDKFYKMRILKYLLAFIFAVATSLFLYNYWDNRNLLSRGDVEIFDLEVGDQVTIKVPENQSTGYANCWVNEDNCKRVELSKTYYKSSFASWLGNSDGAGGAKYFKFKALSLGTDTIKIHNCPVKDVVESEGSDCDFFKNKIEHSDYKVVIRIEE